LGVEFDARLTQINAKIHRGRHAHSCIRSTRSFDVRRFRRWLATLMIVGFASAQFISLAHACMSGPDVSAGAVAAESATMPADCPVMTDGMPATHTACEAHCVPRAQADKAADVRIALAPPSFLVVRLAPIAAPKWMAAAPPPLARIASPPLSLFGRFLI
jgi:hypothetical protein